MSRYLVNARNLAESTEKSRFSPPLVEVCLIGPPRASRVFEWAITQPIVRCNPWHHIDQLCIHALSYNAPMSLMDLMSPFELLDQVYHMYVTLLRHIKPPHTCPPAIQRICSHWRLGQFPQAPHRFCTCLTLVAHLTQRFSVLFVQPCQPCQTRFLSPPVWRPIGRGWHLPLGMGQRFQNLSSCPCVSKDTDMHKAYLSL